MINVANLTQTINGLLERMDRYSEAARKAMGVKPDLGAAQAHIKQANAAIEALALAILECQAAGVLQPPNITRRINECHEELGELLQELVVCLFATEAGNHRPSSPTTGKNASN